MATCPTMAAFLQRLPLPRLVHFLDMILPQMVPVQSPCQSRRRRFASSYRIAERHAGGERGVEFALNATKLFWSRSGIMHVAIAWDHKPLLLLATALLPNRSTESFEREAGPPYDKQRIQMGLRSGNTVLQTSRGRDSISFGSMSRQFVPTLLGCLNSWLVPTAVLPWTDALTFLTVKCTTCRDVRMSSGILWCSRIYIILEIPRVPRNSRSFSACPVKG